MLEAIIATPICKKVNLAVKMQKKNTNSKSPDLVVRLAARSAIDRQGFASEVKI